MKLEGRHHRSITRTADGAGARILDQREVPVIFRILSDRDCRCGPARRHAFRDTDGCLDGDLVAKLQRISQPPAGIADPEARAYQFVLRDALEAAQSSREHAQRALAEQEDRVKRRK